MIHGCDDLIRLFNQCFEKSHQTRLVKGLDEPIYLPRNQTRAHHEIHFAHGFFSSALHECAHWFIAGASRRQLEDYGYWYVPDGRDAKQQREFQQVEVKPQALEWLLCRAARFRFQFSIDNLSGVSVEAEVDDFKQRVYEQALNYQRDGLPARAQLFHDTLLSYYKLLKIPQPTLCDRFGHAWVFLNESRGCFADVS